jgi:hypothetical protein
MRILCIALVALLTCGCAQAGKFVKGARSLITLPGQVISLAAGTPTATTVPLTWSAPITGGTPTDYIVEYGLHSSGIWSTFIDGVGTTLSATVTGLTASTAYDFRVSASNVIGAGTVSATVNATTAASGATGTADLTWTQPTIGLDGYAISGHTGYKVWRATTTLGPYTLVTTIADPTTLTYQDTALASGTYYWVISSYNTATTSQAQPINPGPEVSKVIP